MHPVYAAARDLATRYGVRVRDASGYGAGEIYASTVGGPYRQFASHGVTTTTSADGVRIDVLDLGINAAFATRADRNAPDGPNPGGFVQLLNAGFPIWVHGEPWLVAAKAPGPVHGLRGYVTFSRVGGPRIPTGLAIGPGPKNLIARLRPGHGPTQLVCDAGPLVVERRAAVRLAVVADGVSAELVALTTAMHFALDLFS